MWYFFCGCQAWTLHGGLGLGVRDFRPGADIFKFMEEGAKSTNVLLNPFIAKVEFSSQESFFPLHRSVTITFLD